MNAPEQTLSTRRQFMQAMVSAGGGYLLAAHFTPLGAAQTQTALSTPTTAQPIATQIAPSVLIRIEADGTVRILAPRPDMGQGVKTSGPMLVAEELDADWSRVVVEQAHADPAIFGSQYIGGSRSTPGSWEMLRRCGATARAMLIAAAATAWNVPAGQCSTDAGFVLHGETGRRLSYGDLAARAAAVPVPDPTSLVLKSRGQYRIIGQSIRNVDAPAIVTGAPLYAMDVHLPNMRYAAIARAPALRAKPLRGNYDEVRRQPGVIDVFPLEGYGENNAEAIACVVVIADSTWHAFRAKQALRVEWDAGTGSRDSWTESRAAAKRLWTGRGSQILRQNGSVDAAFDKPYRSLRAEYAYPFLAHATLEPQVCTAWIRDGRCELWAPAQSIDVSRPAIARMLGMPLENVTVHLPRLGGGFGRRLMFDFMTESVLIAQRVAGPVKVVWTREDDFQYDYYRPAGFHGYEAALDRNGDLTGWRHHFVTFSYNGKVPVGTGIIDPNEFPMPVIANAELTQSLLPLATRTGPWRAPRSNGIAFAQQGFLNEVALAAGRDHVEFLIALLGRLPRLEPGQAGLNPDRAIRVIRLAAEKAGWGRRLPRGRGLGIAFYFSHAGHFAEAVELSVDRAKRIRIHQITVAGDIGLIVNPLNAEHQVVGSVIDGLSAAIGQQITMEQGAVQQANFHQYPLLRIPQTPPVRVYWVDSGFPPTGVGEPALPPLAPALTNAIYAASGVRVRELPLSASGYSLA